MSAQSVGDIGFRSIDIPERILLGFNPIEMRHADARMAQH